MKSKNTAVVGVIGILLSAFLPWVSMPLLGNRISISGYKTSVGSYTAIIGVLLLIVLLFAKPKPGSQLSIIGALLSIISGLLAIAQIIYTISLMAETPQIEVGLGNFLSVVFGGIAFSAFSKRQKDEESAQLS